jgi:drug/metabolite transporter (DMT)-like permease
MLNPLWLALISGHLVASVAATLTLRRAQLEGVDPWTIATAMQTGMTIAVWAGAAIWWRPTVATYSWRAAGIIVIAAVLVVTLHYANAKTLLYMEASVYAVFYNLRLPLTAVLGAALLEEGWNAWRMSGGVCMLAAVFTIRQTRYPLTWVAVCWGVLTGLVVSLSTFAEKTVLLEFQGNPGVTFLNYAMPGMTLSLALMWLVLALRSRPLQLHAFRQHRVLQVAAWRTASSHSFGLALAAGGALSVTNYVSSLSVVLIMLFGVWRLGERDALHRKLASGSLAFLGVTLIFVAALTI